METSDQRLKVISHETREVYRLSQPTALSQCNNALETKYAYAYASSPRCGTPCPRSNCTMLSKLTKVWNPCPTSNCTMLSKLTKVWNPCPRSICTMVRDPWLMVSQKKLQTVSQGLRGPGVCGVPGTVGSRGLRGPGDPGTGVPGTAGTRGLGFRGICT